MLRPPRQPFRSIFLVIPILMVIQLWYQQPEIRLHLDERQVYAIDTWQFTLVLILIALSIAGIYWMADRYKAPMNAVLNLLHLLGSLSALLILSISAHEMQDTDLRTGANHWIRMFQIGLIMLQLAQAIFFLNVFLGFLAQLIRFMRR
jgi:hypothetical protein